MSTVSNKGGGSIWSDMFRRNNKNSRLVSSTAPAQDNTEKYGNGIEDNTTSVTNCVTKFTKIIFKAGPFMKLVLEIFREYFKILIKMLYVIFKIIQIKYKILHF